MILQKLAAKNMIKIEEIKPLKSKSEKKKLRITLLEGAESIIRELARAQQDYDEARFADFTEEELTQYARFQNRIKEKMTRVRK